ncbi:hypothetical protein [Dactylosporangium sp. NPDC000521]|uniref:hypothetical protein n=1 Tax=Dactylosporangium sp. NPDC000521 TaxID=3363975 RepID=UPI0036D12FE7
MARLIHSALGRYMVVGTAVGSAAAGLWLVGFGAGSGTVSAWSVMVAVGTVAGTVGALMAFGAMSHGRLPSGDGRSTASHQAEPLDAATSVECEPALASASTGARSW